MKRLLCVACLAVAVVLVAGFDSSVEAAGRFRLPRRSVSGVASVAATPTTGMFSTAQSVADYMARTGLFGHFGGNTGYEGCGMGATPYAAEMNCCYRRTWQPREVGLAQAANGMWYACCRY